MDKNKKILWMTALTLCYEYGYEFNLGYDPIYSNDPDIIDCQLALYLLLLTKEEEDQDKRFKEFEEKYKKLTKEKQEYIKMDLETILKKQDKNEKEKEKKL